MMKRGWIVLPLILCALLGNFLWSQLNRPRDEFVRSTLIGQKLPAFELPAIVDGVAGFSAKDFADGKPRLLNLFGSWCQPCITEAPQLEALKRAGAEIYGIALKDKSEAVTAFLGEHGNPYARIGSDPDWHMPVTLGSTGVPETYVIAGDGSILYQHIGEIRADDVPMLLKKLDAAK